MSEHLEYIDLVKKIVNGSWGPDFNSLGDAEKKMVGDNQKLTAWCLVTLLKEIQNFKQALLSEETDQKIINLSEEYRRILKYFYKKREEKHGPCPESIKKFLEENMQKHAGWFLMNQGVMPSWVVPPDRFLPSKGTELRKEYDRWMRRKPKKAT